MGTFETLTEKTVHQSQNVAQAASVMPEEVKKVETPKTVVKKEQVTANAQTELLSVNPYVDTFKTKLNEKKFTFEQPKESTDETVDETVKDKILRIFHDQCIAIDQLHVDEPYVGLFLAAVGDDFLKQLQKAHDDHFPDMLTQDDVRDIQSKLLSLDDWASHKSRGYLQYKGNEKVYCNGFFKSIPERAVEYTTDLVTDGIESIKKTALALAAQAEKTLQDAGEKVPDMEKSVQEKLDALKKMLESKNASSDQIKKANDDLSAEVQKLNAELNKPTQTKESSEKKKDEPTDTLTKTIFGGLLVGLLASLRKSFGGDSWLGNLFKEGARSLANWMGDELKDEQATSLGVRKITNKEGETEYVYALASDMLEDLEFSIETHRGYAEKLTLAELAILAGKKDVTPPQTSSLTEEQKKILTENCNEQLQDLYTITSAKTNPSNEYLQQTTVKEALEGESVVQDSFYAWLNKQPASAVAKNDKSGSSSGGTTGQTVTG